MCGHYEMGWLFLAFLSDDVNASGPLPPPRLVDVFHVFVRDGHQLTAYCVL